MHKRRVARSKTRNSTASARRTIGEFISSTMTQRRRQSFAKNGKVPPPGAIRKIAPSSSKRARPQMMASRQLTLTEMKREEAIQRYIDLYDMAPTGYVSLEGAGRIAEINLTAAQLLGMSRGRMIGMPFSVVVFRDDMPLFMAHLLRCRCSDAQVESEIRLKNVKREVIHAVLISRAIAGSQNNGAVLYQTSILDLTERRLNEQRLREQARLLNLTNDAILVRDAQDRIIYWNQGARELYGYSPEEALGRVSHELLRTARSEALTDIRKKFARDNRWLGELIHTCKDGSKVVVISRWSLDRDAKGAPSATLETNTDITDRKRAEERAAVNLAVTKILSESPALIDAVTKILEVICVTLEWQVGVFWIPNADANALHCVQLCKSGANKFTRFKAACMKFSPTPGVGLPGRVWKIRKTAWISDIAEDRNFPRAAVAAKQGLHAAFAFPVSSGKHFFGVMEFFSTEVREPDENLVKMFAAIGSQVGQFVQRKQAEEALQRSKKLLEKRVRERTRELRRANKVLEGEITRRKGLEGEILSVSDREQQRLGQELHDGLCQHLTAVAFMARSVALRLKQHRVVDSSDIDKIAQLVNDAAVNTRELSRALHRLDVDAAGLIGALQDLVDREIWRTPCRLEVTPSFHMEDDATASHLYRIAREAVINANKHAQAREIVVKLQGSKQGIDLRITDDGIGISKDAEFTRGLGFHIMNYRAQLIGGRLEISSPKHGGTCISCSVPNRTARSAKPGLNGHPPTAAMAQNAANRNFRHLRRQRVANG